MVSRHNMYRNVHKGLRRALCALLTEAGSADPTVVAQREIAGHWQALRVLLRAHHHHEDAFIGPHLSRLAPALFTQMEAEHGALDALAESLDGAAEAIVQGSDGVPAAAHAFYEDLARFVGAYLGHMAVEEGPYLRALQAAYDDVQLAAIDGELVSHIPPDLMVRFCTVMLPAMNAVERTQMFADMQRSAPPSAFLGTLALAESVLDASAWQGLKASLAVSESVIAHA